MSDTQERLNRLNELKYRCKGGAVHLQSAPIKSALDVKPDEMLDFLGSAPEMLSLANELQERVNVLEKALRFYADPSTYFAIGIFPDSPCGEFADDYSEITKLEEEQFGWEAYRGRGDNYFGKTARQALSAKVQQSGEG